MFALAIVIGQAGEASSKFRRWLRLLDPANAYCPHIHERQFSWGWVGVAGPAFHVLRNQPGQPLLVVHGAVLDEECRQQLRGSRDGDSLAAQLPRTTGQFVFALAREHPDTPVIAGMDNMGMKPLFWGATKTGTVIANHSSLCGLLRGSTEPNPAYIRDFVVKDAVMPGLTLIRDVDRVPRGYYLRHQSGKTRLEPTGFRDLHLLPADREAALAGLRKSTRSLHGFDRKSIIGLTGGLDARLMLALLMVEKVPFEAGSHNMPCLDGQLASQLARLAGVPHWNVNRRLGSLLESALKCLSLMPWSEGCLSLSFLNQPNLVHDMAAARGLTHLGGLGGEPARSYWDQANAEFATPHELLDARFFTERHNGLYPDRRTAEESQAAWHSLVELEGQVDPFVFAQLAFFDARLRGTLVLRANGSWYDYAWPLANPHFYAYSLRLPRPARQEARVFHDFIETLAPTLASVRLAAGNAGDYRKRGLTADINRIKQLFKNTIFAHQLQGRILRLRQRWTHQPIKPVPILVRAFLRDRDAREWVAGIFGARALACFDTGSSTYLYPAEKCASLYLTCLVLRALSNPTANNPLWELPWLRAVLNAYEDESLASFR